MSQNALKPKEGGLAPLFDRLVDEDPTQESEPTPLRALDKKGLFASIRRELNRLCNTRSQKGIEAWSAESRTAVNYGIPDTATLSPRSPIDMARLARALETAFAAYEPRLRNATLAPVAPGPHERSFRFRVSGDAIVNRTPVAISFPIAL